MFSPRWCEAGTFQVRWDESSDGLSKDHHSWGQFGDWAWSINVLEDRLLYGIHIKGTAWACVVPEDPSYGLDTYFSSAVVMSEGDRG